MADLITPLRGEILRLARREIKAQTEALRATVSAHRKDIAALKRENAELRKLLKTEAKQHRRQPKDVTSGGTGRSRITSKGVVSLRKRLGLSAADLGKLLGVSPATIYIWESKAPTPKPEVMARLAELRTLGKKEVAKRIAAE